MKSIDLLQYQDKEAVKNTYSRLPNVTPNIENLKTHLEIKTIDVTVKVEKIEEIIFNILCDFKYIPFWLIKQWYESFDLFDSFEKVSKWIKTGLVWVDATTIGLFIRPTKLLLDLFKVEVREFKQVSFTYLNHNCSEAQVMFDIAMGNLKSEMWTIIKEENTLPCFHPLDLEVENDTGTTAIRENDFRSFSYKEDELIRREHKLKLQIEQKQKYTEEFRDFTYFPLVNYDLQGNIVTQAPDIVVPIPRINSSPQSYAIEIELSPKTQDRYNNILKNYKDNIKFGKLFYLCSMSRLTKMIKKAYKTVGGLGSCELYILPFVPPALRLTDFSNEDETHQVKLLEENRKVNQI